MPSHDTAYAALILMRLRTHTTKADHTFQWYEYLVERSFRGEDYRFPQAAIREPRRDDAIGTTLMSVASDAAHHGMLTLPTSYAVLERCKQHVQTIRNCTYTTFYVHLRTTQSVRADRRLRGRPRYLWVTTGELGGHIQLGSPRVVGLPVHDGTVKAFNDMPVTLRFASDEPPLALYHGTNGAAAMHIPHHGFLATARQAMLGTGIYLGRWDKAEDFAKHDAENELRHEPGVVLRCLLFPGATMTMTADMICECGCGRPFADHNGVRGRGFHTVFLPDGSRPAASSAEWCVRYKDRVLCDGMFDI